MRKLFYEDINMTEFEATVVSCEPDKNGKAFRVLLDATAFFPEEGGQSADKGTLDNQAVTDVQIENDLIYHFVKNPIDPGKTVTGLVDFDRRFDFMQQHSGEHIISGLVNAEYGFNNVGFHLSDNEVTLDFDGILGAGQLAEIELSANRIIYKNLPIEVLYPDKSELQALTYRSKIEIDGQVRLIKIPGVDLCACCAPHVSSTGQIGLIKITQVQSYKGGIRLNILCGERALKDYCEKKNTVTYIAKELSVSQEKLGDAFDKLRAENQSLKETSNLLQAKCLNLSLSSLPAPDESKNAILFTDISDNIAIRNAVNSLTEKYDGFCAVFSGNQDNYRFTVGSRLLDCGELAGVLRSTLGAKCGGNRLMIQGSVSADKDKIIKVFE